MKDKNLDLCVIGNALIDIFIPVSSEELEDLGFEKGSQDVISAQERDRLLDLYKDREKRVVSGGACANSAVIFSQLGGKSAFMTCLGDDKWAVHYKSEFDDLGIHLHAPIIYGGETGTVLCFITEDGERTMRAFLGIAGDLAVDHIEPRDIARARWLLIDGYVYLNEPHGIEVIKKSVRIANESRTKIAFTLADKQVVRQYKQYIEEILPFCSLVICNRKEASALIENQVSGIEGVSCKELATTLASYVGRGLNTDTPYHSSSRVGEEIFGAVVTDSENGAFVSVSNHEFHQRSFPCQAIDATGAGDAFAGAFLYGVVHNVEIPKTAEAACKIASRVVSQVGARIEEDPKELWEEIQ